MGSSERHDFIKKKKGDLGLDQFFNRFSAMNDASEHQDEAN